MLFTILVTVVVLGVLIFVHELGHFVVAKAVGIEVPRFSIGLGPKMVGFRRGGTEYVISWLPLGGYVKMAGMADDKVTSSLEGGRSAEPDAPPSPRDFEAKPLWARTLVILAGVTMNWLFALAAFTGLAVERGVHDVRIGEVNEGSPAEAAGLQPGDLIRTIDGARVTDISHVTLRIDRRPGEEITLGVEREGRVIERRAVPDSTEVYEELVGASRVVGRIGVLLDAERHDVALGPAIANGWRQTLYWTRTVLSFLVDLVTGESSVRELGGPIMIGQISGEAARAGIWPLVGFMAVISINLAVLNLLPIPVLDGGHLLFLGIEAVSGRALSVEQRIRFTTAGMVLVVGLMLWAIGNDLLRLIGI